MFDPIDAYCERLSAAYWAEPVNAVTNLAFLLAAWVMWRRTEGLPLGRAMSAVLAAIGVKLNHLAARNARVTLGWGKRH